MQVRDEAAASGPTKQNHQTAFQSTLKLEQDEGCYPAKVKIPILEPLLDPHSNMYEMRPLSLRKQILNPQVDLHARVGKT